MKLTDITFIFENCDSITINGCYIGDFVVDDIKTSIGRIASNSIEEMITAASIAIEIARDANNPRYQFEQEQIEHYKQMTFDRFKEYSDITAIEFNMVNEHTNEVKHYHYYVNWCGDSDYENTAQSVYISKPGNLYIVIKNETDVLQFFDVNTIDDEEYMKFKFTMYDIEEGADG